MSNDAVRRAAEGLRDADALLITTGAGMGVDSGLGTFRGRNAGVWAPLKALQLDFSEMSCPSWFDDDPRLAWAFWHFRHQAYTKGTPHAGYAIMANWGVGMKHGLFSVTSNIDGHWERTALVGSDKVLEVHGAVTHMQCVEDTGNIWETVDSQISNMKVPVWDLKPGEAVELWTSTGTWVPGIVGDDGGTMISSDSNPLSVKGVRRPGQVDLCRVSKESELPKCLITGMPARPNVLMFGDWGVNCSRIELQESRLKAWKKSLPHEARLIIVEVGAGKAVSTIRRTSESIASEFPNSMLVRINLDDSDVPSNLTKRSISIGGLGALEALLQIDDIFTGKIKYKVIHSRVAVRKEPSFDGEIVGAKKAGDVVITDEIQDGWIKVPSENGWMLVDGAEIGLGKLLQKVE